MSKEIKSVRVRRVNANIDERLSNISTNKISGALGDIKVTIKDDGLISDKYEVTVLPISVGYSGVPGSVFKYKKKDQYKDFTSDDFIKDAIITYANNVVNERGKKEDPEKFYEIIQDPWQESPPIQRSYGFDRYILNNESSILVKWFNGDLVVGGTKWSSDDGLELDVERGSTYSFQTLSNGMLVPVGNTSEKASYIKKVEIWGGEIKKQSTGKQVDNPQDIFTFTKKRDFSKTGDPYEWSGIIKDTDIIQEVISNWKMKVVKYDSLALCDSSYRTSNDFCDKLPYISPLSPDQVNTSETTSNTVTGLSASKIKMTINFPKDFKVVAREDIPDFQIYVGEPTVDPTVDGFIPSYDDMTGLDPEYSETKFIGLDDEFISTSVMDYQEDSLSQESNNTIIDDRVDIGVYKSEDDLLKIAGKMARVLGKSSRVNYDNLKKGYIKGIHGLCPQGTQAVLAALTGIIRLGKISGNADWFSFKSPGTGGGNSSFSNSIDGVVYYKDKVKISQKNGSWNNTYLKDKSKWQVGDIIAMGYLNGKLYGHIQVWTGYSWHSDFKQGNSIQQHNVDPDTVALWRLNENGIKAIKKQSLS